jgi:hypothetical protein
VSRYLQRLAQRSGIVVSGAAAGESPGGATTASLSLSGGASPAQADAPMGGIEVVEQLREVSQPGLAQGVSRSTNEPLPDTGQAAAQSGPNTDTALGPADMVYSETSALAATEPPGAESTTPGLPGQSRESGNHTGRRDRVPEPASEIAREHSTRKRQVPRFGHDEPVFRLAPSTDDARRAVADSLSADSDDATGSGHPTAADRRDGRGDVDQPPGLIDQAIQWVMDDPYWSKTGGRWHADDTPESDTAAERQLDGAVTAHTGTQRPAQARFDDRREPFAPAPEQETRALESTPDVQVHIGRVTIDVHQAEAQGTVPPATPPAARGATPGRAFASTESRLRRLYLRGI